VPRFTSRRCVFRSRCPRGWKKHYGATLPGHSSDRGGCRRRPTAITEINTTGEPAPLCMYTGFLQTGQSIALHR